jgi:hypothetical protein
MQQYPVAQDIGKRNAQQQDNIGCQHHIYKVDMPVWIPVSITALPGFAG